MPSKCTWQWRECKNPAQGFGGLCAAHFAELSSWIQGTNGKGGGKIMLAGPELVNYNTYHVEIRAKLNKMRRTRNQKKAAEKKAKQQLLPKVVLPASLPHEHIHLPNNHEVKLRVAELLGKHQELQITKATKLDWVSRVYDLLIQRHKDILDKNEGYRATWMNSLIRSVKGDNDKHRIVCIDCRQDPTQKQKIVAHEGMLCDDHCLEALKCEDSDSVRKLGVHNSLKNVHNANTNKNHAARMAIDPEETRKRKHQPDHFDGAKVLNAAIIVAKENGDHDKYLSLSEKSAPRRKYDRVKDKLGDYNVLHEAPLALHAHMSTDAWSDLSHGRVGVTLKGEDMNVVAALGSEYVEFRDVVYKFYPEVASAPTIGFAVRVKDPSDVAPSEAQKSFRKTVVNEIGLNDTGMIEQCCLVAKQVDELRKDIFTMTDVSPLVVEQLVNLIHERINPGLLQDHLLEILQCDCGQDADLIKRKKLLLQGFVYTQAETSVLAWFALDFKISMGCSSKYRCTFNPRMMMEIFEAKGQENVRERVASYLLHWAGFDGSIMLRHQDSEGNVSSGMFDWLIPHGEDYLDFFKEAITKVYPDLKDGDLKIYHITCNSYDHKMMYPNPADREMTLTSIRCSKIRPVKAIAEFMVKIGGVDSPFLPSRKAENLLALAKMPSARVEQVEREEKFDVYQERLAEHFGLEKITSKMLKTELQRLQEPLHGLKWELAKRLVESLPELVDETWEPPAGMDGELTGTVAGVEN